MPLRRLDTNLWCLDSHFVSMGCKGSVRMTVVATVLGLVLYSPVDLCEEDVAALERIAPVAMILAPNLYHHLFLRQAVDTFAQARVYVPQGLEPKIGPIVRARTIAQDAHWLEGTGLEAFTLASHAIRETVLFHPQSETLIVSDLLYNYQDEHFLAEKAFFRLIGCYARPAVAFYHRFSIRRGDAGLAALLARIDHWQPRRIVMSHGRIIERDDCSALMRRAWAFRS